MRIICIVVLGCTIGCQRTVTSTPSPRPAVIVNGATAPDVAPPPLEKTLKADPCASRLHEICGAMLEHYALRGRLPSALEGLQATADTTLTFACPATGQPYTYVPLGLQTSGDDRLLILHDSIAEPSGSRWAILMRRPRGRQPISLWVVQLPEPAFRAYTPRPPSTAPTVPPR